MVGGGLLYDGVLKYLKEVSTGAVTGATKKMVYTGKNVTVLKMVATAVQ